MAIDPVKSDQKRSQVSESKDQRPPHLLFQDSTPAPLTPKKPEKKHIVWQEPLTVTQAASTGPKRRRDTKDEHKHPREVWSSKRARIEELFHKYHLAEVVEIMAKEGFKASPRYKHHLKKWGAWKYIKRSDDQTQEVSNQGKARAHLKGTKSIIQPSGRNLGLSPLAKIYKALEAGFEKIEAIEGPEEGIILFQLAK